MVSRSALLLALAICCLVVAVSANPYSNMARMQRQQLQQMQGTMITMLKQIATDVNKKLMGVMQCQATLVAKGICPKPSFPGAGR